MKIRSIPWKTGLSEWRAGSISCRRFAEFGLAWRPSLAGARSGLPLATGSARRRPQPLVAARACRPFRRTPARQHGPRLLSPLLRGRAAGHLPPLAAPDRRRGTGRWPRQLQE